MIISLYHFLWAMSIGSLFILIFHLILRNTDAIIWSGLGIFVLAFLLCLLRIFVPLDFSKAKFTWELPDFINRMIPGHHFLTKYATGYKLLLAFLCVVAMAKIIYFLWRSCLLNSRLLWAHSTDAPEYNAIFRKIDPDCPIPVRKTALVKGPVIHGYIHPVIYIPIGSYSDTDIFNIISHEYTHWKNHHLPVKFTVHIFTLLMWWNPFVYILERDISHVIELLCDDLTLASSSDEHKLDYMSTIMRCLQRSKRRSLHYNSEDSITLHFAAESKASSTLQRFNYAFRKTSITSRIMTGFSYIFVFCFFFSTYFMVIQPAHKPEQITEYSNDSNAYVVESMDGSYFFYYEKNTVPVTKEEFDAGYYKAYPFISYNEYEDSGDYKLSKTYKKYFE